MTEPVTEPVTDPPPNVFFPFVVIAGFVFVVTILALIAGILGDGQAPIHRWLNTHGTTLIIGEVVVIGISGVLALVIDRWQTLRSRAGRPSEHSPLETSPPKDSPVAPTNNE